MFEGKNKFQNKLRQSRMGKIIDRLKKNEQKTKVLLSKTSQNRSFEKTNE